jgi:sterol desaturase/sphingolipid hydroxylase (fatty acid hydroxylase superfamily)
MLVDFVAQLSGYMVAGIQWVLDVIYPSAGQYGVDASKVLGFTVPVLAIIPSVLLANILERARPIEDHTTQEARATIRTEWMLVAFMATIGIFLHVALFIAFGRVAMAIGGPVLFLEAQSVFGFLGLVVVYALYIDCAKYWMHRLSHMIPLLWATHSFHHSAERLTVATGARHHWADKIVQAPMVLLTLLFFQVPEHIMSLAIMLTQIPDGLQHLNYKIAWHRVGIWINTPQWHRIHHSVEPRHFDKNFSSAFPIMDVIFGTAHRPEPDEYPDTGLTPRENPRLWEGIIWPFRGWLARRREPYPSTSATHSSAPL